jgi:DNA-binding NarL/FixJ family response regulator
MDNDDAVLRIEEKLEKVMRLLAVQITSGLKREPAIQLLAAAGLERQMIADVLNTTPNTVSVIMSTSRARGEGRARRLKKPTA